MKKTIRLTAAALAAITAISCTSVASFADDTAADYIGNTSYENMLVGGWSVNDSYVAMSKNPEAKAAFKKATEGLTGVSYKAIAVLGTQVVAGTNYAILCKATTVYPGAQPEIKVMYIYEDLMGNAEITGFQTIIGEMSDGGFSVNTGKLTPSKNKTVYSAYKKAMKELDGVSYTPVAYLGSQVVAGTNYLMLCRSKVVYPGASCEWSLVTVYKDLKGKASALNIETLELGKRDDAAADEGDSMGTQIPNPWQEYKTLSEAGNAAGVSLTAPKKLGSHKRTYIQAMTGIVEASYTKEGNKICIRKGTGTEDISGDYNAYKSVTEKKINGSTVTLKGSGKGVKTAVWTDGEYSYSVTSEKALTERFMESIIAEIG